MDVATYGLVGDAMVCYSATGESGRIGEALCHHRYIGEEV